MFCGAELNHLSTFGRGHNEKPSSSWEVILNLDQLFRRYLVKKKFTDGQRPITEAHLEPSAQVSQKLKCCLLKSSDAIFANII